MASSPSNLGLAAALLAGFLLVAFPWLGGDDDAKPTPTAFKPTDVAAAPLFDLLSSHDRACKQGDVAAFEACVTKGYFASLERSVGALDRRIDGELLRSRVENGNGLGAIATRLGCRGRSLGDRACILGKPSVGRTGTLCLGLVREGGSWRIDRVVHQPLVALDDALLVEVVETSLLESH